MTIEKHPVKTFRPAWPGRVLVLPLYVMLALTLSLIWFSSLVEVSYENRLITLLLNTLLITSLSLPGAWLAVRGYLASGRTEMLSAACGLIAMGASTPIASLLLGNAQNPNDAVTVHNLGIFLASSLHLSAALQLGRPRRSSPRAPMATGAFLGVLALIGLFSVAAKYDLAPAFYVVERGTTPVRQLVLMMSVAFLAVAGGFILRRASLRDSLALRLYGLGLWLIATGLIDVSIAIPGSVLSWAGRVSQAIGHVYLPLAFLFGIRTAVTKGFDAQEAAADYYLESQEHYRTLVKALNVGIISLDPKGRVVLWNPQAEVMFGCSYAEAAGKPLIELIAAPGGHREAVRDLLEKRAGRYVEVVLHRISGFEFPAEVLAFEGGGGWTKWTNLIIRDVSERRQKEDELRTAHDRIVRILESIEDGFFNLDRQFRIKYINEKGVKSSGHTRETMLGRVLWEVFPEVVGSEFERAYLTAMTKRVTTEVEAYYRPLGAWFEARAYPSEDGISVFFRDVTGRKQAEETLRRYELISAHSRDIILHIHYDTGRILEANAAAVAAYGYSREELLNLAIQDLRAPETLSLAKDQLAESERKGILFETIHRHKDGSTLFVEVSSQGATIGGVRTLVSVIRDISERKAAQEALRRSEARFRLLADVAAQLLATSDPQAQINKLAGQVMGYLDCQCFFNFLVAKELPGRLKLNTWAGIPAEEARRIEWLDYGVAVCGCVARDGVRIVAENIPTTPDVRTELVKSYGIKAYACHPLVGVNGRLLGTLSFGTRSRETFSEEDLGLMKAVTDQVAVALVRMQHEQDLRRSAESLQQANERLEEKVRLRTCELEEAVAILRKENLFREKIQSQLQQLSRKSLEALEADRQSVARELHDSIGGSLAAIKFEIEGAAKQVLLDPVNVAASLEITNSHLADTIKETKRISANLRPLSLDDLGLLATIEWYVRQFCQQYKNIRVDCQIDVEEQEIPEGFKIVFYRVMQEALNNAARHSQADTVCIRLTKSVSHFEFEVEDNGCGFDVNEAFNRQDRMSGFGLKSMQERTDISGGVLNLHSRPGSGTSVKISLPFDPAASGLELGRADAFLIKPYS